MAIKDVLGFSLKPVKVDPDGFSAPPDPASLAPPSAAPDSVPPESALRASIPPDVDVPPDIDPPAGESLPPGSLVPGIDDRAIEPDELPAPQPRRPGPAALLVSIPPEPLIVSAPPPPLFASVPPRAMTLSQPATGAAAAESVLASLAPPAPSEPPPVFSELLPELSSQPPEADGNEPSALLSSYPEAAIGSRPPEPTIASLRPVSDSFPPALSVPPLLSMPPSLSVPPSLSLSPGASLDAPDSSASLSLAPIGGDAEPQHLAASQSDEAPASLPPDSGGAGRSLFPEGTGQWSSSALDPALASAPAPDLFATRVEGLSTPEPPAARSDTAHGAPRDESEIDPLPEPTDEELLAAAGVRRRIDLRSGLLLGFAAFTSVMSAACFVLLLLRAGPAEPAATEDPAPAGQGGGTAGDSPGKRADEAAHGQQESRASPAVSQGDAHDEAPKPAQIAVAGPALEGARPEAAPAEHAPKTAGETITKPDDPRGHGNEENVHGAHAAKDEGLHGAAHGPPPPTVTASPDPHADGDRSAVPQAEPVRASGSCRIVRPPRRLVRDVSPRVPLEARVTRDGDVLLGYVKADGSARAVKLEGSTQRVRDQTSEPSMDEVTGVVPLGDSHDAAFALDHPASDERTAWRSLPGPGGFALSRSRTNQLFLLSPGGKRPAPLWSLPAGSLPTRPVVAPVSAQRYVLALRDGEPTSGQIRFGWVDVVSGALGKLETLPLGAVEVGAPALGVRGEELLIAVALRDRAEAAWRVELWRAGPKPPSRVVLPALQQGEVGDQIAPRLSPLDGERWALQWTSGRVGKRHVDLLVLDAGLKGLGEPLMVSGVRSSGGGGLLVANPPQLLSLYLVQSAPEDYDLWLRVLDC